MPVDRAEIDRLAGAAAGAEHVEPWRAGEQRRPDGRRPKHVPAKGKLIIPALDDRLGFGARCLVGGIAPEARLHVEAPRPNPHDGPRFVGLRSVPFCRLHGTVASLYLEGMLPVRPNGFIEPRIPTRAAKPPVGPDWVHEIKHDGYRLMVRGASPLVRLFTRRGFDWTDRYPAIAGAAAKLAALSFTIDGEAVVCGPDGVAVFDAMHRRQRVSADSRDGDPRTKRGRPRCSRKTRRAASPSTWRGCRTLSGKGDRDT
jgi:ATP dependent DNA ligase-like protein